jgi:hypothetical protein
MIWTFMVRLFVGSFWLTLLYPDLSPARIKAMRGRINLLETFGGILPAGLGLELRSVRLRLRLSIVFQIYWVSRLALPMPFNQAGILRLVLAVCPFDDPISVTAGSCYGPVSCLSSEPPFGLWTVPIHFQNRPESLSILRACTGLAVFLEFGICFAALPGPSLPIQYQVNILTQHLFSIIFGLSLPSFFA